MTVDVEKADEGAGDGSDCEAGTKPPGRWDVMTPAVRKSSFLNRLLGSLSFKESDS